MENWLVLPNFYKGLTPISKGHVDAAAGGAFLSLTIADATALIEKDGGQSELGRGTQATKRYAYLEGDGYACIIWNGNIACECS